LEVLANCLEHTLHHFYVVWNDLYTVGDDLYTVWNSSYAVCNDSYPVCTASVPCLPARDEPGLAGEVWVFFC
jgi:hypothetical protein